jgi:hypothetical protein
MKQGYNLEVDLELQMIEELHHIGKGSSCSETEQV